MILGWLTRHGQQQSAQESSVQPGARGPAAESPAAPGAAPGTLAGVTKRAGERPANVQLGTSPGATRI